MANVTVQAVLDQARGYLHDIQVSGGEVYTNTMLLQTCFPEGYRRAWRCMSGSGSKRVQRVVWLNLPANTTVLIPSSYNILDFAEPELVEERPATTALSITSTDTSTPINVTVPGHNIGAPGAQGELLISGVAGTTAPWGQWGVTVIDSTTVSLNGSVSDGTAGTGGTASFPSTQVFTEVLPANLAGQCIDGQQQQALGCYLWINEQLLFRGSVNTVQLRITYWSSGTPPILVNQYLGIDDAEDFIAAVTAANAAQATGFYPVAAELRAKAFGASQQPDEVGGLLLEFINLQIKTQQRGPQIRRGPFRIVRNRWGNSALIP